MDNFLYKHKIDGELLCNMENFIVPLQQLLSSNIVLKFTLQKPRISVLIISKNVNAAS